MGPMGKIVEKAHADLSASGSEIWLNCPGSPRECRKVTTPEIESPAAKDGTKAHKLLEVWLKHNLASNMSFVFPRNFNIDMIQAVRVAVDFVGKERFKNPKLEILVEEKISLDFIDEDMWGTADLGIFEHFGELAIWDYKHGVWNAVDVEKINEWEIKEYNTQLVYYLLGLAHKYDYNFASYRIGVIQPRAKHSSGNVVRSAVLTYEDLMKYKEYFERGVARTKDPKAKLFSGPWCKWCKAKRRCPEQRKFQTDSVRKDFQ